MGSKLTTRGGIALDKLSLRFTILVVSVIIIVAIIYLIWTNGAQQQSIQSKALAEARTLNIEISAVWDYISDSQHSINYNSDGTYDFKGIYCAIAGKAIARHFTSEAQDYQIRYVRENPRNTADTPDVFEQAALDSFDDSSVSEYWQVTALDDTDVFRYVSKLTIERECLDCHGSPAGEKDDVGYLKEGMQVGDIAGAVSIVIPLTSYEKDANAALGRSLILFAVLAIGIIVVISVGLRRWITGPLHKANVALTSENSAKTDYLAVMSHELRTPLSSIIAYTDIMQRDVRAGKGQSEQLIKEVKQNSQTLLEMVNNTIDVAKLEEGRFEIVKDDVDLVDVIGAVFSVTEPLAIKKNIALLREIDRDLPILTSDWEALYKITINLVSNAIKFTDSGSVTVGVHSNRYLADGSLAVEISVVDTGCGISASDLEFIFGKYAQSGFKTAASSNGSGLGLYLVKTLTDKLGGSVAVSSEIGKGSTFTVLIPVDHGKQSANANSIENNGDD